MTTLGISMPTSFGMIAGACVASAFNVRPDWAAANANGLGFLVQTMLYPRGFADFLLVVFVLSGINVNIIVSSSTIASFYVPTDSISVESVQRRDLVPAVCPAIHAHPTLPMDNCMLHCHPCPRFGWSKPAPGLPTELLVAARVLVYFVLCHHLL